MALILNSSSPICALNSTTSRRREILFPSLISPLKRGFQLRSFNLKNESNNAGCLKAFFFNPTEDPVLKEAFKECVNERARSHPFQEPVAFMGGMFAGLLRLDLNEDPLKDWVNRTVEAAGITEEEIDVDGAEGEEEVPQQIEIE